MGEDWERGGFRGSGNVKPILGSATPNDIAIVCGNGRNVFDDLEGALECHPKGHIFAANDIGAYLPNVNHWISLHADKMPHWRKIRELSAELGQGFKVHSNTKQPGVNFVWWGISPVMPLSGYFAMQVAYLMGYGQIILCGCPGSPMPRFFEQSRPDGFVYGTDAVKKHLENEMARVPEFKKRVRSMSGYTQEFFGGI